MTWTTVVDTLLALGQRTLLSIAGTPITAVTLMTFLVIVILTFWLSNLLQKTLEKFLRLRGVKDEGTIGVSTRITHYLLMAMGLGVGLQTLGINLNALFAAGAFLAVAFGFATQNITQNFVAGVILLLERTIKPGDILHVESRMVRVARLGTRAMVARTLDDEDVIIPNSIMVQSTVTNYTLRDSISRLRATVGVTYGSDMKAVREVLEATARDVPWRNPSRDPVINMISFGSSSVDWEVSVWIDDPWRERSYRSQLFEAIWFALAAADIVIAFPQLDIHLDPPVLESFDRMTKR